jgi:tRNA(fMet)-specific endonuclease VapC
MILLDTDHLNLLVHRQGEASHRLITRMDESSDQAFATSIISVEEQMRGWLAEIHRRREISKQIAAYDRLADLIDFWNQWNIVRMDDRAAEVCEQLKKQRIRVGTQDLKIAAIALASGARLLSANLRDFERVAGLQVEDWLH